jgi:nitrogen regulatory protein PII
MSLELVTAIIKPHKLEEVKEALLANGIEGLTVTEVRGFGRQRGKTENFRGSEYNIDFIPKVRLDILVPAELADKIVTVVVDAAAPTRSATARCGACRCARSPVSAPARWTSTPSSRMLKFTDRLGRARRTSGRSPRTLSAEATISAPC